MLGLSNRVAAEPDPRARDSLFTFVLVKPTHYDDDGYPIQWFRSAIPSNTLACLNGLAEDAQRREVLGPGVAIRLQTFDETNRRVRPERIIRMIRHQRREGARANASLTSGARGHPCRRARRRRRSSRRPLSLRGR